MNLSSNTKGAVLALAAFGIYSSHDVIVKVLGNSYSAFQIVFFSVLLGFPLATLMLMRDTTGGNLVPIHPWWSLLRSVSVVATGASAFYAFSTLPLATVYAILFATPLLITILSIPVLGEVVRLRRWIAILVGLAGVIIVLRPDEVTLTLGHGAALTAAIGASIGAIVVRKIGRDERTVVLMLYPMVANFLVMGAILPFVYRPMPVEHFGMLALIAICAFAAGLLIIGAYKSGEAVIVAPMQYSQIIWASLYGMLFFNEIPDLTTIAGASIVISSGLYILLRESKANVSQNTPNLRTRSRPEMGTSLRVGHWLRPNKTRQK
ncbi:MAG: drug/metabolite transporter (DMT)-like permease [Paracoccaceae bacterium]|jgi:drug/metabolite transporter (DMT)-like permease|tara:strand:+ start:146 stop:1108 length:963 start_codon:yes stop_codon:yes gene_type:complete